MLKQRPRINRRSSKIREMVQESHLHPRDLILPLFVCEGQGVKNPISSLPGHFHWSLDQVFFLCQQAKDLGLGGLALFPVIPQNKKDSAGKESLNPDNVLLRALREIKAQFPELCLVSDVALDPYSSDGHDGLVKEGKILNDESVELLVQMALCQAEAGADYVAPSDMMDGRVGAIRQGLEEKGLRDTGIISYCAKYASACYGPFREALDSAPKAGDKKTYQMDPANAKEALREAHLDQIEGADLLMVKPALCYLDVIYRLSQSTYLPLAAYNVSGEFAMIKAAAEKGWIEEKSAALESLISIKRSGADVIFSYWALEAAKWLQE